MPAPDVEMLAHRRNSRLVGQPTDHRVAHLFIKVISAADQRIEIARRDRGVAELSQRVQRLGKQLFLAAEDSQHRPCRGLRTIGYGIDCHFLERVGDQELARACEDAVSGRRGGGGARPHHVGSCSFHISHTDMNIIFVSIGVIRNSTPGPSRRHRAAGVRRRNGSGTVLSCGGR